MATPVTGRKRQPQRERLTAEDDALSQIAREAEARLAAKRAARAEAREIRMKELERQQKEKYYGLDTKWGDIEQWMEDNECCSHTSQRNALVEEKSEQDFTEKDLLAEAEEKYKKAMVSNAQLDNEKTNFMYQVDTLKDVLLELEEQLAESRRQYEEKSKEMERQKYAHSVLQFQFNKVKEVLQQREEMLMEIRQLQQEKESYGRVISNLQETIEWKDKKIGEHGIILNSEIATNGETSDKNEGHLEPSVKVNSETSPALKTGAVHPGRANEVEMKSESMAEMGKGGILQITENKECKEETETREVVKAVMEQKTLHHDENVETKGTGGHENNFVMTCANNRLEEQIPSVTECVFSAKRHGVNELGESTFLCFGEEVECVCSITKEQFIVKQGISDTLQSQSNIIDQTWEHNKPEKQYEIQADMQSWENEKQGVLMDKGRESCNEEFQDVLDFVVNSYGESLTDLLALGEDDSSEAMGTNEIETYNNSVKIKFKNQCHNESKTKHNDLEREHEEGCFDMGCDKVEYDKKVEGSGMEEVQSWEIQNNSIEGLKVAGVDSGIISNEIRPKPTESEKIVVKCNNEYPIEESKEEHVRESMISPGDHSQEKHITIQMQAIKDIKNKNKKEKKSKKEVVETKITPAETPVKYQCSHDVKNSSLEKTDSEYLSNILPMDEEEPNQGSSTKGNSECVKLYFEDAETYQKMNQKLKSPSNQEIEKGKQGLSVETEEEEMDCTTKAQSRKVAEQNFNSDEERNLILQESGKQLIQHSCNIGNVEAIEKGSRFLESTEENDQTAKEHEKEENISIAKTETKNEQDREGNMEIIEKRQLDNEDKNEKIEMENDLQAVKTVARQIEEKVEMLPDMKDEKIVEDTGEAFDFDNDINQMEAISEHHHVDKANMNESGKAQEHKPQTDDGDSMPVGEEAQSKIKNEEILNKVKVSQQIEAENSQGTEHFIAVMNQSCPELVDETEEKTSNSTEEISGNLTRQLDDIHEDVAKSQIKEDDRKDDGADKGNRKGKGKNKEDCLVS